MTCVVKTMHFSYRNKRPQHGGVMKVAVIALLIVIILPVLYTELMLHWSYSTGERAGWLQKLSHKGFICKTTEGELSMIAIPGAAPEKFYFTVRDDEVAKQIDQLMGRRVSLHYEQKVGLPTSCFGDTEYFVTAVQTVDEPTFGQQPAAGPAAIPATPAPPTAPH